MEGTLKEYLSAYKKALGLFVPTNYVWRPFGELLEIDRCEADGDLVTNSQESTSAHVGHRLKAPTRISIFELIKIWLRIIR